MANPPTNYAPASVPYLGTEEWYAYCSGDSPVDRSVSVNGILSAISSLGVVSLDITGTTASTSTTTGALIVAGGAGIAGALYLGGSINSTALYPLISTSSTSYGPQLYLENLSADSTAAYYFLTKGRPGPAAIQVGDNLGAFAWEAYDSAATPALVSACNISAICLGVTSSAVTASMNFNSATVYKFDASVAHPVYTIAQLLALSPSKGWVAWCSDTVGANAMTFHAIIAGSGANTINCQVIYDGTHWLCT